MLYRGDSPMTSEEALDYEYECVLNRLCEEGLVLRVIDAQGRPAWIKTLRGQHELGDPPDPGACSKKTLRNRP